MFLAPGPSSASFLGVSGLVSPPRALITLGKNTAWLGGSFSPTGWVPVKHNTDSISSKQANEHLSSTSCVQNTQD